MLVDMLARALVGAGLANRNAHMSDDSPAFERIAAFKNALTVEDF